MLDRVLPGQGRAVVVKKVLADQVREVHGESRKAYSSSYTFVQLIFTPPLNVAFFFCLNFAEHFDVQKAKDQVKTKIWPVLSRCHRRIGISTVLV